MIQEHAAIMHTAIPWALLLLLLLDWNPTAAEPQSFPTDRGNWCSEHRKLHSRLEVVEERVEKTVEYLYSEVSSLLDAISGSTWALSVAPSGPILNIFEEGISSKELESLLSYAEEVHLKVMFQQDNDPKHTDSR